MLSHQEQLDALASLVDDWAIKKNSRVKGEYTSVDFVTFKLNQIFTPGEWSFTILDGPTLVTIKETAAYAILTGRLEVRFADGTEAHQDDVGIWPLVATGAKAGKPLTDTAPERYETVLKAARTDCLKNAARNLGTCFSPLTDLELRAAKRRADYEHENEEDERSATQDIAELYGSQDTTAESEPPAAEETTPNGLDKLLEDVNAKLAANTLEPYESKANMVQALKDIGHRKYAEANHETMVSQLIMEKEPNGKEVNHTGEA